MLKNTLNQETQKPRLMLNICYSNTQIKITRIGYQMRKIIQAIIEARQRQADLYLRCLTAGI
jgi:hypothetical protein